MARDSAANKLRTDIGFRFISSRMFSARCTTYIHTPRSRSRSFNLTTLCYLYCKRFEPLSRAPRCVWRREETLDMIQLMYLFPHKNRHNFTRPPQEEIPGGLSEDFWMAIGSRPTTYTIINHSVKIQRSDEPVCAIGQRWSQGRNDEYYGYSAKSGFRPKAGAYNGYILSVNQALAPHPQDVGVSLERELVATFTSVESGVRVLRLLKTCLAEEMMHVKLVEAQSTNVCVE
ncbi:hypothetical protein TNCV_1952961 [Trichonephila clavipes]|nr:hypothetical protein TNCV_1952961 [Trichonephila clavipes]